MGSFHRRIVIVHRPLVHGGEARAVLEDDFHHFRVVLAHEFEQVSAISGQALRNPYTMCPAAGDRLQALLGTRLDPVAHSVTRLTDASEQCTHLFDLAGLALAAANAGRARRQYDIEVADRPNGQPHGPTRARLSRDGDDLLDWQVQGGTITAPPPFAGVSLHQGLARWALAQLDADTAEAAIVLRRGTTISVGRQKNLDAITHAAPTGRCYAQQPARAAQALRNIGSTWDFSHRADSLCADDMAWLAAHDELPAQGHGA